jgi:hypothetical protein
LSWPLTSCVTSYLGSTCTWIFQIQY